MLCHIKVSKKEQKVIIPTFFFSPEIKESPEKQNYKRDNYLHGMSLQQRNLIIHLPYKNFISCKNDSTLFYTGLDLLNTLLYKICRDFQNSFCNYCFSKRSK